MRGEGMNKVKDTFVVQSMSLMAYATGLGYMFTLTGDSKRFYKLNQDVSDEYSTLSVNTMIKLHNRQHTSIRLPRTLKLLAESRKIVEVVKGQYSRKTKVLGIQSHIVKFCREDYDKWLKEDLI